ncbi:MAG: DUF1190 domain-containing protein [Marinobacterium sp.]|nr:DUF1190 domain-containing protein [Marinobacterium sp.]
MRKAAPDYDWKQHIRVLSGQASAARLLLAGSGVFTLAGCSQTETGHIYTDIQDCVSQNPEQSRLCKTAYHKAYANWRRTTPEYMYEDTCEQDFYGFSCERVGGRYQPAMSAFMLYENGKHKQKPILNYRMPVGLGKTTDYTSSNRNRWLAADGQVVALYARKQVEVPLNQARSLTKLKTDTRVLVRGGDPRLLNDPRLKKPSKSAQSADRPNQQANYNLPSRKLKGEKRVLGKISRGGFGASARSGSRGG